VRERPLYPVLTPCYRRQPDIEPIEGERGRQQVKALNAGGSERLTKGNVPSDEILNSEFDVG
jgi:hypothetical protein